MRRIWNNLTSISLLPALFTCICLISCSQDKAAETLRSAYYWSTTWQMDSSKMNFIQKHHIKRLYVRFFDVVRDADGEIMPNATLQFDTTDENKNTEEKPELPTITDILNNDDGFTRRYYFYRVGAFNNPQCLSEGKYIKSGLSKFGWTEIWPSLYKVCVDVDNNYIMSGGGSITIYNPDGVIGYSKARSKVIDVVQ